jgi:LPS export ABC transporter protein LptC
MRWLLLVVIAVVVLAAVMLRGTPELDVAATAVADIEPRYRAEQIKALRTDAKGAPLLLLNATAADYYDGGSAVLHDIETQGLSGATAPWVLKSPLGTVPEHEKRMLLHAPVTGDGRWPNGEPLHFAGAEVWVDQTKRQFSSDQNVRVESATRNAKGRGFVAGFDGKSLTMNQVELQYVLGN